MFLIQKILPSVYAGIVAAVCRIAGDMSIVGFTPSPLKDFVACAAFNEALLIFFVTILFVVNKQRKTIHTDNTHS